MTFLDLIGPGRFIEPAVIQESAARGDDWYPYAAAMPLTPESTAQPKRAQTTTFILHTESGPRLTTLEALVTYVSRLDVAGEPTAILDMDGRMAQLLPIETRADNNYKANAYATSIETQDEGTIADPGIANTPWTDEQLAQLAGFTAWQVLHPRLDIPLRRADQGPTGGGVDGHYRYPEWSTFVGKTCPGLTRRGQIDSVLAAAQSIVEWHPEPPPTPEPPDEQENQMAGMQVYIGRDKTDGRLLISMGGVCYRRVKTGADENGVKSRMEYGVGPVYYNPKRANEVVVEFDDIPELDGAWVVAMGVELAESKA